MTEKWTATTVLIGHHPSPASSTLF